MGKKYSDARGAQIRCETRCRDSCWRKEDVPFREAEVVELGLNRAGQCTIRLILRVPQSFLTFLI